MKALKISGCMNVVSSMSDIDRDSILSRLDQYRKDGIPVERAQMMAASDVLAELQDERREFMVMLKQQHPDLFRIEPDVKRSTARDVTETEEFKRWFGDSVMTENGRPGGKPLLLYHGGYNFADAPGSKAVPKVGSRGALGVGFYMTPDEEMAQDYADVGSTPGGKVNELYARITRPLVIGREEDAYDPAVEALVILGMPREKAQKKVETAYDKYGYVGSEIKRLAQEQGYDGIAKYNNRRLMEVVVWSPNQVKSATHNDGKFSWNPDIRRSVERTPLGFYSALARGIESMDTRQAPAAAWKSQIKGLVNKGAAKADEIEWSGINDFLDLQEGKVTKEQVLEYLKQGGVQVEETVLGDGKSARSNYGVAFLDDDNVAVVNGDSIVQSGFADAEEAEAWIDSQPDVAGKTKYGAYTLPGGENYREVLLTLPTQDQRVAAAVERARLTDEEAARYRELESLSRRNEASDDELAEMSRLEARREESQQAYAKARAADGRPDYTSTHWAQRNVLAHIRLNDRTDADGNKVLFVEELQSDWGQEGKKKGFAKSKKDLTENVERRITEVQMELNQLRRDGVRPPAEGTLLSDADPRFLRMQELVAESDELERARLNSGLVPAAPFVTKTEGWLNLALKRVMTMAVEGGYDRVAFVNGEQSADRYDLSKQVSRIVWNPETGNFYATPRQGEERIERSGISAEKLPDIIGKEAAERLVSEKARAPNGTHVLKDGDLKVGGEGMKAFYDTIVPTAVKKLLPKVGGGAPETVNLGDVERGDVYDGTRRVAEAVTRGEYESEWGDGYTFEDVSEGSLMPQPGFSVTDAMREKVAEGLPLFSTGRTSTGATWDSPSASKWDDTVYKLQDKQVDLKRVIESIKEASGSISEDLDVYLQEELYHGRAAKRTEDFANMELAPLVEQLAKDGLEIADLEEFLHARHAKEANEAIAKRNPGNPNFQDGGSGMMTADAQQYLATLPVELRTKLEAAAAKVDDIIKQTRQLYVEYELESQDTVDLWASVYQHYIPLMREDKDGSPGLGQGFSVKGRETKGRTGSKRKVVNILANVAMQRERAIVRGEKNRVSQALVGLAQSNPNDGFWTVDEVPKERVFNPDTGLVEERTDPLYKSRPNAVVAKIADADGVVREHAVIFNEDDQRAMRMAGALKNLDAAELEGLLGVSAKISRYFASVNTQWNPVFGVVNLIRDVQSAVLNLSSTPIGDIDKAQFGRNTVSALAGIYSDARGARKGKNPSSQWARLWDEFQEAGGQTGFRELFRTSADRAKAIENALNPDAWMDSKLGTIFTAGGALKVPLSVAMKGARWIFDWISDYNLAFENGVRLAAYKAALDKGMSKERAASVAKNLTVNFNRKGQVGQQAGALYAFFNASVQGTARMGQTLFTMEPGKPKTLRLNDTGKKIVYGGMLLGSMQALALAAAGFNEDDPPEFVRERSLIIPILGGKYITIPMPLGFHVLPGIGRVATEFALSGFKNPHERALSLASLFAETFNPIGNAGISMQTIAPTALDPLVALTENRDWTGRPITRESSNKAIPGHALGRDTATSFAKLTSEAINTLSGGNKYVAGVFSPTPDQIDFLIGQVTGGVGRELSKVEQTVLSTARGEALPTYKIPLAGRFIGDTKSQASEGTAFYANTERLNELETEIKGLKKDGKNAEAAALRRERSEAYLITAANRAERQIQRLRQEKRELIKAGADRAQVRAVEEKITETMARLNRSMEELQKRQ